MVGSDEAASSWTIDELAVEAGVPSRTIREYQRLELLPPPRRDGRVGRYGSEHRARLSIVGRLQERGYSLAAIGDLMGSWEQGRGLGSVLGVDADPAVLDEAPTELTDEQLTELVPAFGDPDLVERAISVGLLHVGDGTIIARSVAALELVGLAIAAGTPPPAAVEIVAGINEGAATIAAAAIAPFVEHLWPRRAEVDVAMLLSRARLLMAQAAASLVVHELGVALGHQADLDDTGELAAVVDRVAIGQLRRLTPHENEPT
ncbi:MAG: MerR family transcriptional regulator [Acidimicrobiia bacterium]|nr:MerR family transcriptional regulator [Acidimicrobiia bacterium]